VVIGETAIVGDYCVMFHNVTLGGTGKYDGQRHRWSVTTCSLGQRDPARTDPDRRSRQGRRNAFVINHDVPAHSTVVGTPARL